MTELKKQKITRRDYERALGFLEEFGWLLRSFPDVDFHSLGSIVQEVGSQRVLFQESLDRLPQHNKNAVYLVGILPVLFVDETIFPQNEDIADFALETLHIKIPRWQKKSKYEIIGHIVCNASSLGDRDLVDLVNALELVTRNDKKARNLIRERQDAGLSWSETIQMINRERR